MRWERDESSIMSRVLNGIRIVEATKNHQEEMMICPNAKRCEQFQCEERYPHKKIQSCDNENTVGCPACVPVKRKVKREKV